MLEVYREAAGALDRPATIDVAQLELGGEGAVDRGGESEGGGGELDKGDLLGEGDGERDGDADGGDMDGIGGGVGPISEPAIIITSGE